MVGLGASAGGLEALETFFTHVRPGSEIAYVVVTHQHRSHTSLLPEVLAKHAALPVMEARDGLKLKPDHVYIAPPGGTWP